jgi:uncharacterized protein
MTRMIFISLPVSDLAASVTFYEAVGFASNPSFSDATAQCMIWSEAIQVMLLTHEKWSEFTIRPIPPSTSSEVALGLTLESRQAVDIMNDAAGKHGGTPDINPVQDHGFMYGRDFADLDGHIWGPMWMDPAAIPPSE